MGKRDLTKTFIDELYSSPPKKNYETKKIINNLIDEIWSIDLIDMINFILKDIDTYSLYLIISQNMFGLYHFKTKIIKQ